MSAIDDALNELGQMLAMKNADYKVSSDEFSNFRFAAEVADVSPETVALTLIGIKLGRLKGLLESGRLSNFESIKDTKMDLANYAIILYAMDQDGSLR